MTEIIEKASRIEIDVDPDVLAKSGRSISDLATDTRNNVSFTIDDQTAVLVGNANLKINTRAFGHIQVENELGQIVMSPQHSVINAVRVDGVEVWKK